LRQFRNAFLIEIFAGIRRIGNDFSNLDVQNLGLCFDKLRRLLDSRLLNFCCFGNFFLITFFSTYIELKIKGLKNCLTAHPFRSSCFPTMSL
jgi:hypothetical protein